MFDKNIDKLELWFDEIAKDNPTQAINLFLKLSKFIVPELKNVETKIENNTELKIEADPFKIMRENAGLQ